MGRSLATPITVRSTTSTDAPAIRHVTDSAFAAARSIYRPNPAAFANLSTMAPVLERLVAESDGQIVGTVRYGVFDRSLRVIGLAVLPEWQRRGVGRKLIEALADIAADRESSSGWDFRSFRRGRMPIRSASPASR
jgi:predicted N-acetyltransferase YhbS